MFTGGVEATNDADVDTLFGVKTPGAEDLLGGKRKKDSNPETEPDESVDPELEDGKSKPIVKLDETPAQKVRKPTDEVTDDLFGKEEEELDENGKPRKAPKPTIAKKPTAPVGTEVDYGLLFQKMVDDGVVGEVELPEGVEWNAETFREALQLNVKTQYDDLLDKTGPYGKAIIDYEKNGGNPSELINLFREQRTVKEFDVTSPEGQEEFLTSYLEAQGYSVKSIDRTIKALIDQGADALKEEAEEKKSLWDNEYNEEIKNTQAQQAAYAAQVADQAKNFNKTISQTLTSDTELTPKDRKELGAYILSYSQKFNGNDVSQFYLDMAEIQKDPTAYVELAKFIKGLKTGEYKKKIEDKTKKQVSASTFMKVKNGSALSQRSGEQVPLSEAGDDTFVTYLTGKKK